MSDSVALQTLSGETPEESKTDHGENEINHNEPHEGDAVAVLNLEDDSFLTDKVADVLLSTLEAHVLESASRGSTPSDGNAPRDCDMSSGSPSPVPDDALDILHHHRPKIQLGRDISLMMQALNSLHSPEEKIAALCKKYADLLEQQKVKDKRLRGLERRSGQVLKEKEQMQKELNKAVLGKSKMESLARELNKQNKLLKEESFNMTLRHKKEREQMSVKFQATTDEISGKINSIADRNELLNTQNQEMATNIAKLVNDTTEREKVIKAMMEQRDLQENILKLKVKKADDERDIYSQQHAVLSDEVVKLKTLCEGYKNQEKILKTQITYYSEKFEDFQSTLDKSNGIFESFRSEMDRMNKKMKDLEKATATWKKNYEQSEAENKRILSINFEQNKAIEKLKIKLARLTNLSRALQAERNELAKNARLTKKPTDTVTAEATSTVSEPQPENNNRTPNMGDAIEEPTSTTRDGETSQTQDTSTNHSMNRSEVQESVTNSTENSEQTSELNNPTEIPGGDTAPLSEEETSHIPASSEETVTLAVADSTVAMNKQAAASVDDIKDVIPSSSTEVPTPETSSDQSPESSISKTSDEAEKLSESNENGTTTTHPETSDDNVTS
uniref:gamma-taxilin-like n=1 Tax=Styela clava TaxID=7725 RepID=UPI001939D5E9|nr:gamma-taxilin-like [Styela clava]